MSQFEEVKRGIMPPPEQKLSLSLNMKNPAA
jgi:hypothetical protein